MIFRYLMFCLFYFSITHSNAELNKEIHWQKLNYIEQSFYEIALQNEYNSKQTHIRKWNKPLLIYIKHEVGDKELHLRLVKAHLTHLSEITGLTFSYTQHKADANLTIFLTRSNQVNSLIRQEISTNAVKQLKNSVCLANIQTNQNSEIIKALVILPVDRARMHGKLISCVVEELTQILGLPNDSKTIYPTIFSDRNIYKLLTGLDYLLLKLLYLPEIKSGMTKHQIKPIIQKQLKQWNKDGTIKNAQKNIVKGDLYPLTGYR